MHTPLAMLAALAHAPHGRCDATGRLPGVPAAQASPTADMPALFSPGIIVALERLEPAHLPAAKHIM